MGDRKAQEECTRQRIVLQCPFCGRKDVLTLHLNSNIYHNYQSDCVLGGRFVPLSDWNTRPAPPVGRCGECRFANTEDGGIYCELDDYQREEYEFCSEFEPKGSEENG